ncbi:MAG: isoprenylcysteine carboxylmethyltransferase family protein [Candidatus Omnitrophica bacterium]|nr:isoprenylcysteine carboxylmethyltransferase family protein [Candidatus Omnitrophota bacterium]
MMALGYSILAALIFIERIKNTFVNKEIYQKFKTVKETLLCGLMVVCYAGIFFMAYGHTFSGSYRVHIGSLVAGLLLLMTGVWYRSHSIQSLGKSWSVYRTPDHLETVVTSGAYHYARHPYYAASLVELMGYGFIFQSKEAIFIALGIYLPLLVWRSIVEEFFLRQKFPEAYATYCEKTPVIFNPLAEHGDRFTNQSP